MAAPSTYHSSTAAFFGGVRSALASEFFLVIMGTYTGIGALGLSAWWLALSSMLVWAAPAQVILISAFGGGAPLFEVAIAVCLSAIRLFPMVVALLPLLRGPGTRLRDLLFPTHFTYCVQYSSAYWSARSYCCLAAFYLPASHPAWMAAASILACSANTLGCSFSLTGGFIVTPALRGIT